MKYRRNLKVIATPNLIINGLRFNTNGTRILESEAELDELKNVPNKVMEFKLADGTVVNPAPEKPVSIKPKRKKKKDNK